MPVEICDGIDNDGDGVIDNSESCWLAVDRYWKTSSPQPRCYASSTLTCSGYTLEYGSVYFLYAVQVSGTVGIDLLGNGDDRMLVREDRAELASLQSNGWTNYGRLGYIWSDTANPPSGTYYKPAGANTSNIRTLRRYYNSSTNLHLFPNNPAEAPSSWTYEGVQGYVWGSRW